MVTEMPMPVAWMQVYTNTQGQKLYSFCKDRSSESDLPLYGEEVVIIQAERIKDLETALAIYKNMWDFKFAGWGQREVTENETK